MIKTARRILKEKNLDFDRIKAGPKDSREYRTVSLIEFVSEWLESHAVGERLAVMERRAGEVRNTANPETKRGYLFKIPGNYREGSWHNRYHTVIFDPDKMVDPIPLLVALGYAVWTNMGMTYVGLVRRNY